MKSVCGGSGLRTECAPCRNGTFLAAENSLSKCKACTVCDSVLNQIELRTCEAGADRKCGCPRNTYEQWLDDTTFNCHNCTVCPSDTIIPCSTESDAVCACEGYMFYHFTQGNCQPCERCQGKLHCGQCKTGRSPYFLLSILSSSILLGTVIAVASYLVYRRSKRGCRWSGFAKSVNSRDPFHSGVTGITPEGCHSPDQLLPVQEEGGGRMSCLTPTHLTELPDCVQVARAVHLPDTQRLSYAVADVVPASRWREFVRRLGLPDAQIERAEMEARPSFREAQYQMFQLWLQRQGGAAPLQPVYRALRDMELNGCAEQLQERLQ